MDVVAVDISGRHAVGGRYYMLCAAVAAVISPRNLERIIEVRQIPRITASLDIKTVADLIIDACFCLDGTVLVERGDLFNLELWRAESILGRNVKYPESMGEMRAIELAHHVSVAGRRLFLESEFGSGDEAAI